MKKNKTVILISCSVILCIIGFYCSYLYKAKTPSQNPPPLEDNAKADDLSGSEIEEKIIDIKISAVGDIMVHDGELNAAKNGDIYDFTPFFESIKPFIEPSDLSIGNLETTIAGKEKKYTGYPMFNSPDTLIDALKWTGFDVLITSNNHSMDRGEAGIIKTIEALDNHGILHTGTYKQPDDRNKTLIVDVKGIKLAIISYTYGTNGIPVKNPYQVNLIDMDTIQSDIQNAKQQKPDMLIAYIHQGSEYMRQPNSEQKQLVENLFSLGVDIVLGDHPHVVQPAYKRSVAASDGSQKDVFVIYSLGNFISDQRGDYKDLGVITNLYLEKNSKSGKTIIKNVEYIPTWVQRYNNKGKRNYRILSIPDAIKNYESKSDALLSSSDYNYLKKMDVEMMNHIQDIKK